MKKYKVFDRYAQQWFYCWASSSKQATNLIRRRVLALIGKYNLSEPVEVRQD